MQGLYSWLLAGQAASDITAQLEQSKGYDRADQAYFSRLMRGAIEQQGELEAALAPCLDRKVKELSPVERGILLLGAWELKNAPEVPYRVVINEAVELAKSYGGTDGHKYVNGVLDKLARSLRTQEDKAGA
jgi:N utilization substance protein B